jgi:hypothetical protein
MTSASPHGTLCPRRRQIPSDIQTAKGVICRKFDGICRIEEDTELRFSEGAITLWQVVCSDNIKLEATRRDLVKERHDGLFQGKIRICR